MLTAWHRCLFGILLCLSPMSVMAQEADTAIRKNVLFIIDGSSSMWGRMDGYPKIQMVKDTLKPLVKSLGDKRQMGLMAFGHRDSKSCDDIEILASVARNRTTKIIKKLDLLETAGRSPLARTLEVSFLSFDPRESGNNHIVLIIDGADSCKGDVCHAVQEIKHKIPRLTVHTIAFDMLDEDRERLECISELTQGKFYFTPDKESFTQAVKDIQEVIQQ